MKEIFFDGMYLCDREKAHEYLQEVLDLPEYYGKNLDALYDCLTDMEDLEIQIKMPEKVTPYFERIIRVFKGAGMASESITLKIVE